MSEFSDTIAKEKDAAILQAMLANFQQEAKELALELDEKQISIEELQTELDRRTLESYWQAHPELLRLGVGDKLLVTEEVMQHIVHKNGYNIGDIGSITKIDVRNKQVNVTWDDSGMAVLYIGNAQHLRKAYLESQAEGSKSSDNQHKMTYGDLIDNLEAGNWQILDIHFEVGDKLLVTDSLFDLREREGGFPRRGGDTKLGEVCELYQTDEADKGFWFVKFDAGVSGLIPTDVIQDMRQAYIESQAAHE